MGSVRVPSLSRVYVALLSPPYSNADCERSFSLVRKIHTDTRKTLLPKILTAYLQCKLNYDSLCHDFKVTPEMRRLSKGAAYENKLIKSAVSGCKRKRILLEHHQLCCRLVNK